MTAEDEVAVDVTDWAVIRDEPGGRDPHKRWLAASPDAPRHEHWLWKSRQRTGGGSETAITDCAEVFVSRPASRIDLPAAVCRFAVCNGEWGLISRNVCPDGFSLNTGATYLPEVEGYERPLADSSTELRAGRMRRDRGTRSMWSSRSSHMSARLLVRAVSARSESSLATWFWTP